MRKFFTLLFLVFIILSLFAAKEVKKITSIGSVYQLDGWIGNYYQTFINEYNLKIPFDITIEFISLGTPSINRNKNKIVIVNQKITTSNRAIILRDLMLITLEYNSKSQKAYEIIEDFFKKHRIK